MKHVLLFAAAILLAPTIAGADDISGAWKFEATGPRGGASATSCALTRTGDNITGSCVTAQGTTVEVTGTVNGDNVDFGYNLAGGPLRVEFRGAIQPDGSIKGTVHGGDPARAVHRNQAIAATHPSSAPMRRSNRHADHGRPDKHGRAGLRIGRRVLLAMGGVGLALGANRAVGASAGPRARFFVLVSGPADGPEAQSWQKLVSELEKRDFPTTLVPTIYPNASFTPNEARAAAIVAALKEAKEPGVILGVSNEGNVLPLVAAAHSVRRLVYVNACIPQPQKAFIEICLTQPVAVPGSLLDKLIKGAQPVTDEFLKLRADPHATDAQWAALRGHIQASPYASAMKGFYEVCPLREMPKVENIDVSGSADDQINPAWERATARRVLITKPVIVPGAGHANVVTEYAAQVADAAVRGL